MRRALLAAGGAAALVLAASACASSSPTTTSAGAASPGTSSTPATAPATPSVVDSGAGLTGFGATFDVWNATRNPDGDFDADTAFGADPSLPQINGHTGARYVTVSGASGYVTSYQVNFPAHTKIAAVLADILSKEFPSDATYLWKKEVPGECYQAEVKSAKLATALTSESLGDGTGLVFLEAKSLANGGAFDAADVSYAMLQFQSITSAAQAPGC